MRLGLACTALTISHFATAQLVVDPSLTAQQVVTEILVGEGVQVSNITFSGDLDQIGSFDAANSNILIPNGLIMASGTCNLAVGPNNSGSLTLGGGNFGVSDPDLNALSTFTTNDAAVLEFDFIPTGDSIRFNYSFGSEEYNEYVCGTVNDAFGFFLSGPGINGPYSNNAINLAIIPGTNGVPVTINSVNNGNVGSNGSAPNCNQVDPNWTQNTEFYVDNATNTAPTATQLDGFTVVLTAEAQVQCGETYHIKIAIADAGDSAFDSAVFIEGGSFSSNAFDIVASASISGNQVFLGDTTVVESCNDAVFTIVRPSATLEETLELTITGTAINGTDYEFIDANVVLGVGVTSYDVPLNVIADGITEGSETVTISYEYINLCGDTVFRSATLVILDPDPVTLEYDTPVGICNGQAVLGVEAVSGFGPFTYQWTGGQTPTQPTNTVNTTTAGQLTVVVTDVCGNTAEATIGFIPPPPLSVDVDQTTSPFCPGDPVSLSAVILTGAGPYTYAWSFGGNQSTATTSPQASTTITLNVTDGCGQTANSNHFIEVPEYPAILVLDEEACLGVQAAVDIEGGTGSFSFFTWQYVFNGIDPEPVDSNWVELTASLDTLAAFYGDGGVYEGGMNEGILFVTAIDQCGEEASFTLILEACNTLIPNVFSPNNDGKNDFFRIEGIEGFPGSVLLVYNRWGNLIFQDLNYGGGWDGRIGGNPISDGTYYYVLQRSDGEDFHGAVTVVR